MKFSIEIGFINSFFIRGGYNYNTIELDDDLTDAIINTNAITGGTGINFINNSRIDIACSHQWIKPNFDPDEKIVDHIVLLSFKYDIVPKSSW